MSKKSYNLLADEYKARIPQYMERGQIILALFVSYLEKTFKNKTRILDVGPGAGVDLALLSSKGYIVVGIDVAEKMLAVARETCPEAVLISGDIRSTKFFASGFEGIVSKASLHLFTKLEAIKILKKIYFALVPKGMLYLSTTIGTNVKKEGLETKNDYSKKVSRYRRHWHEEELVDVLKKTGFSIYKKSYDSEADLHKKNGLTSTQQGRNN